MIKAPNLLREGGQLLAICAEGGYEEDVRFPSTEGTQEFGLADTTATIQNE
jgi:hypothetical protein